MPKDLAQNLDFMAEERNRMENLRNHLTNGYYNWVPTVIMTYFHPKDPARRDVNIRLLIRGSVHEVDVRPVEIFALGLTVDGWVRQRVRSFGDEPWDFEPLVGGYTSGDSASARQFLEAGLAWLATQPSAIELRNLIGELSRRGAAARKTFESELARNLHYSEH